MRKDWSKEKIKAELALRGLNLSRVSTLAGLDRTAGSIALTRPWPKAEQAIAQAIGKKPEQIWPARYPSSRGAKST